MAPESIGQLLLGPFGSMMALLAGITALIRGDLCLRREVTSLQAQLARAQQDGQRWENLAWQLANANRQAIHVAQSAAAVAHTAMERQP